MKYPLITKALITIGLVSAISSVEAQNSLNVALLDSSSAGLGTATPATPTGYSYSGAAPAPGNDWNTLGLLGAAPNPTTGSYTMYSGLALEDSMGNSDVASLTVTYDYSGTTSKTQPSTGTGENVIQPGGVMQNAWRNYYNGGGTGYAANATVTYEISGLTANTAYDLYFYGGTTGSGQGAGVSLAAGNVFGANPSSGTTANTTENSNGSYGSIFTSNGSGGYQLMAEGTTWDELLGQSDSNGNFTFSLDGQGNAAYMNGFQLEAGAVPEPSILPLCSAGFALLGLIPLRRRN